MFPSLFRRPKKAPAFPGAFPGSNGKPPALAAVSFWEARELADGAGRAFGYPGQAVVRVGHTPGELAEPTAVNGHALGQPRDTVTSSGHVPAEPGRPPLSRCVFSGSPETASTVWGVFRGSPEDPGDERQPAA